LTPTGKFYEWLPVGLIFLSLLFSFLTGVPRCRGAETHDIAVTSVATDRSVTAPGIEVKINVTVENQGTTVESFNLTVYATNIDTNESITIQTAVVELPASANETLTFVWRNERSLWVALIFPPPVWDTDPMVEDFTIWAEASVVDGEVDTSDNVYIDGTVRVILRFGDVDGNGRINVFDFVLLCQGYGARLGDPRYDPLKDHDQDGVIAIYDVVPAAMAYGTQYI